jgi:hypothetical protein
MAESRGRVSVTSVSNAQSWKTGRNSFEEALRRRSRSLYGIGVNLYASGSIALSSADEVDRGGRSAILSTHAESVRRDRTFVLAHLGRPSWSAARTCN